MSAGRPSETDGGVTLAGETLDVIEWLRDCFEKLEGGREHEILSDPFYVPRGGPLTEEKIDFLIAALDTRLDIEMDNYPVYHERRSGANAKTELHRLGPTARRALAEGLVRILDDWDDWQNKAPPVREPEYSG